MGRFDIVEDPLLQAAALGAVLGGVFGHFEQSMPDPRERHTFKYAVLGSLAFAAYAALRAEKPLVLPLALPLGRSLVGAAPAAAPIPGAPDEWFPGY